MIYVACLNLKPHSIVLTISKTLKRTFVLLTLFHWISLNIIFYRRVLGFFSDNLCNLTIVEYKCYFYNSWDTIYDFYIFLLDYFMLNPFFVIQMNSSMSARWVFFISYFASSECKCVLILHVFVCTNIQFG